MREMAWRGRSLSGSSLRRYARIATTPATVHTAHGAAIVEVEGDESPSLATNSTPHRLSQSGQLAYSIDSGPRVRCDLRPDRKWGYWQRDVDEPRRFGYDGVPGLPGDGHRPGLQR
jgi:hypothetical protein